MKYTFSMGRKLVLAVAGLLLVGGAAAAVVLSRTRTPPHTPVPTQNPHGEGMDRAMVALKAMYEAPEGKTPCETAYNAFKASKDVADAEHARPLVLSLAPRDDFFTRCNALTPAEQLCLAPSYSMRHRDQCVKAKPAPAALDGMFKINSMDGTQAGEQDADRQFMSTKRR